jgi:putative (di)nucleoside polyphosphate hydrolase
MMVKIKNEKSKKKSYRKAVFIVVYRINSITKKPEYILLERKLHWSGWEFPKGGIDEGETPRQAVERETKEETGLNSIKVRAYNVRGKYSYPKFLKDRPDKYGQTYELFSAEVSHGYVMFDCREHSNFMWLSFDDAFKKLTWSDQKKCLTIVNKSLSK